MKKIINGYIARDGYALIFSNQPMKQEGYIGDCDMWNTTIEHDERSPLNFRVDMHPYFDIPELTEKESPRHCTITIEVGEFVGEKIDAEFKEKCYRIRKSVRALAEATGKTCDEAKIILVKSIPDIEKYLED